MFPPYENMTEVIPPGKFGRLTRIEHYEVSKSKSDRTALRGYVTPGKYVRLMVDNTLYMSDTDMEKRSNLGFVHEARGDVLVGGLGIGLIILPILKKEEVSSVTVIEKHAGVIRLVEPHLCRAAGNNAKKLRVKHADALTWDPVDGYPVLHSQGKPYTWDVIYWDIWASICTDNLKEITALKRRFARRLNKGGWQGAWFEDELRSRARREKKNLWYG